MDPDKIKHRMNSYNLIEPMAKSKSKSEKKTFEVKTFSKILRSCHDFNIIILFGIFLRLANDLNTNIFLYDLSPRQDLDFIFSDFDFN
ncbi:hypothetical protein BpHYR1_021716 [Brachionus plicatilis]|uniref:Uncharacterized protein n=1 Tax=Brachionus plicatilis TaxID=10195 RepID=A0A3M7T5N4_BRAPC|nr:hypothetical protein BpHYR1_021716 [Brachionus plicatilis]